MSSISPTIRLQLIYHYSYILSTLSSISSHPNWATSHPNWAAYHWPTSELLLFCTELHLIHSKLLLFHTELHLFHTELLLFYTELHLIIPSYSSFTLSYILFTQSYFIFHTELHLPTPSYSSFTLSYICADRATLLSHWATSHPHRATPLSHWATSAHTEQLLFHNELHVPTPSYSSFTLSYISSIPSYSSFTLSTNPAYSAKTLASIIEPYTTYPSLWF
jgi:hypothetical protein